MQMLNNKRTTLGPPLALYSKPPSSFDLATRFPKLLLVYLLHTLRLVWACNCLKAERLPIPYFILCVTIRRAEYYTVLEWHSKCKCE